ncbi:Energy-coupling factor transporter transmembrane protein EcfT [Spiroplasma sp. JKS002669]|uniref:energy-coupling factor transporter transmembrane component T family protein n=1 Tax=Spiroplasma attinicola TaxID=2904537 RepID=UPI002022CB9C|nr:MULTISPECIES: energy-coupling factor transporter transmembrane component T [unclassified Spiroplasma]MCL6428954.1 Energy-coupling factor transporter transmembrane protein EcfT [Spiroplasma sp. JKS002669]MCL8209738.1 Energy-coupling factor transporter transmembrane protein EcfT [Spiroplasma sp. JKS002670]MCL8210554.1 Energy-coupling factor transporter transmembrane protein EcfT [Spiroplasma sp. JKS002671]
MKVSFGRYLPLNSIIHKVDPRIKLVVLISLIVSIFFNTGFTGYCFIAVFILILFFSAKLPASLLGRLLVPMLFIVVILFILNCFIIKADQSDSEAIKKIGQLWHWKFLTVSFKGIYSSIYIGIRIYLMIITTTILTTTTQPLDLTLALEDLMMPLKLIKFPVHIISMIISIALRSIPTLFDEAGRILKAQASRGVDLKNGHFREKIKALVSLIIPLLVSAFQKAEDLAYAMDSRGYDPQGKRTRFRQFKINYKDILFFILGVGLLAFIITYHKIPSFMPAIPIDHYVL